MGIATASRRATQRGQAIAEYVYVVPVMLLLILGAVQFGFIYQAKSTLNYATFVATRAGALKNGAMSAIQEALAGGLAPLFAHDQDLAALKAAYAFADQELRDAALTSIRIVNPTSAALGAYQSQSDAGTEIPNDNLMYRDSGASGGMSLQDANLLKVRVTYCFRMVVPIINKLIFNLAIDPSATAPATPETAPEILASSGGGSGSGPCTGLAAEEYRIPISAEAVVRMQTPFRNPGAWSAP